MFRTSLVTAALLAAVAIAPASGQERVPGHAGEPEAA